MLRSQVIHARMAPYQEFMSVEWIDVNLSCKIGLGPFSCLPTTNLTAPVASDYTMTSGILQGAHDIVLNNPQLNDYTSHSTTITQVNEKKGIVDCAVECLLLMCE